MKQSYVKAVLYGWISAISLLLIMSACLALVIRVFHISSTTTFYASFIIGLLILFISGFIGGAKGKAKGWMLGFAVGIGCVGITLFVQYVGLNTMFSIQQVIYHATYVLAAIIGGIAGVNLTGETK